jgi:hypothetical protein
MVVDDASRISRRSAKIARAYAPTAYQGHHRTNARRESQDGLRFNPSYGQRAETLLAEPEPKTKMTPEQEMLATGSPTLFEL